MTTTVGRDPKASRGYRNKNPGNIDWVATNRWQGQVGKEPAPAGGGRPRFAVFDTHENGIRALALLLTTYQDRHGLRTIRGIVSRWAPGNENDTGAYVAAVARRMGRSAGEVLDMHRYEDVRPLVEAIIRHEIGGNPYADRVIDEGLRRAGLVRPLTTVVAAATQTGTGRAAVGVGATGVAAVAAQAAPAVQALGTVGPVVAIALIVVAVALFLLWRKGKI